MKVQFCYRTKDMEKGKIYKSLPITVKEAVESFKKLDKDDKVEKAYLLRFNKYSHWVYKILKEDQNPKRPEFLKEDHLDFLDAIRADGETNMFGAAVDLRIEYPELSKQQARLILAFWMKTFGKQ